MNDITNTALFDIFKACKKTQFDKEPDFDRVMDKVQSMLDISASDKLLSDIKDVFERYKQQEEMNCFLGSYCRSTEEEVVLFRHNYVKKKNVLLKKSVIASNITD